MAARGGITTLVMAGRSRPRFRWQSRWNRRRRVVPTISRVMAGLVPATYVFPAGRMSRRGWLASSDHDGETRRRHLAGAGQWRPLLALALLTLIWGFSTPVRQLRRGGGCDNYSGNRPISIDILVLLRLHRSLRRHHMAGVDFGESG